MYTILIDTLCLHGHSEQLPARRADIEIFVENSIAVILLDFFCHVGIDTVSLRELPATCCQPSSYSLHMQATGSTTTSESPLDLLELRLEEAIGCALAEHFHTVVIHAIDVYRERTDAPSTTQVQETETATFTREE